MHCARSLRLFTKIGTQLKRFTSNKVDFTINPNMAIRSTKYTTFDVIENMLIPESPDLCTGVLLVRLPRCVDRAVDSFIASHDNLLISNSPQITGLNNDEGENDLDKYILKQSILKFKSSHVYNSGNPKNPLRMPSDTTYLFVKSRILFPDEWYLPTIFVNKYMNIHDAANSVLKDTLNLFDLATISSPFPSVAIHEKIPKTHPLYSKLKKNVHVFIYRAIFHGNHNLQYDKDIIQDVQWLTAEEAKHILKPNLYKKLLPIF